MAEEMRQRGGSGIPDKCEVLIGEFARRARRIDGEMAEITRHMRGHSIGCSPDNAKGELSRNTPENETRSSGWFAGDIGQGRANRPGSPAAPRGDRLSPLSGFQRPVDRRPADAKLAGDRGRPEAEFLQPPDLCNIDTGLASAIDAARLGRRDAFELPLPA